MATQDSTARAVTPEIDSAALGLDLIDALASHVHHAVRHGRKLDAWTLEAQLRASVAALDIAGLIARPQPVENDNDAG